MIKSDKTPIIKLDREALIKFINSYFSQYRIPPLQNFLHLKNTNGQEIYLPSHRCAPSQPHPPPIATALQGQAIFYIQSGVLQLFRWQNSRWRRQIEYKEGTFFTNINYRNMQHLQPQHYKLVYKTNCLIGYIPIQVEQGYSEIRKNWFKNIILANVFFHGDSGIDISRKKPKFRDFTDSFTHEVIHRDTRIVREGVQNKKVFVIAKGEARVVKQVQGIQKGDVVRSIEIVYLNQGGVFGGQLFLMSSRAVNTIISHHLPQQQAKIQEQQEQQEAEAKQGRQKSSSKSKQNRIKKVNVSQGGYQLHTPHQNINNFTVIAQSANLQVFWIEIDRLIGIISQRCKSNLVKLLEQKYITILRRIHQKSVIQYKKNQQWANKKKKKIEHLTAKTFSLNKNPSPTDKNSQKFVRVQLKPSELGMMNTDLGQLKNEQVWKRHRPSLTARADLAMQPKTSNTDFRSKIQHLIEAKLSSGGQSEREKKQLAEDLEEIFMKKNQGRTEDIDRRNNSLAKKVNLLAKRGGFEKGWNFLNEQGMAVPEQRSSVPENYLRGVEMGHFTARVKQRCVQKIHQTNKIKEQFMKISSECPSCTCYQNIDSFSEMRRTGSTMGKIGYKTAQGWGRTSKVTLEEQPLEAVYSKNKFIPQRAKEPYRHNEHLHRVRKTKSQLQRRKSAPILHKCLP